MTTLIWLGEDNTDGPDIAGPSFCLWKGVKFAVGNPVEVSDPDMIRRARGNKFFTVTDDAAKVEKQPEAVDPEAVSLPHEPPQEKSPPKPRGRPRKVKNGDEDKG